MIHETLRSIQAKLQGSKEEHEVLSMLLRHKCLDFHSLPYAEMQLSYVDSNASLMAAQVDYDVQLAQKLVTLCPIETIANSLRNGEPTDWHLREFFKTLEEFGITVEKIEALIARKRELDAKANPA